MTNGVTNHDDWPPTTLELFALNSITASFPTAFLLVVQYIQSPAGKVWDDIGYALQEVGADSAIILIGISFFLATAGDLIVTRHRPARWDMILALGMSCIMILVLVVTAGNQVRAALQTPASLIKWTIIQASFTMASLYHGAILKLRSLF